jgi:hypothetical protein
VRRRLAPPGRFCVVDQAGRDAAREPVVTIDPRRREDAVRVAARLVDPGGASGGSRIEQLADGLGPRRRRSGRRRLVPAKCALRATDH